MYASSYTNYFQIPIDKDINPWEDVSNGEAMRGNPAQVAVK